MKVRILVCQTSNSAPAGPAFYGRIFSAVKRSRPHFVCLPEYFSTFSKNLEEQAEEGLRTIRALKRISKAFPQVAIVAGTVVEKRAGKYYNTCFVIQKGETAAKYSKVFLTRVERARGLSCGRRFSAVKLNGLWSSVMVCNDVLHPAASAKLADLSLDLLFVPLVSPKRKNDQTRKWRDYLFVVRAFEARAYLVKVGSVGRVWGIPMAGRSLAAAPWGLLWKTKDENKEEYKLLSLDVPALVRYRRSEALFRM